MTSWLMDGALVLEVVPPPLREGPEGVEKRLRRIARLEEQIPLDAVNIPEIREETSKSSDGERRNPFEKRVEPRVLAQRIREELGLRAVINRVVVHLPAEQQCEWFRETHERFGVRDFVLVGGERSSVSYPGPTVPEANQLIRETLGDGFSVGNICIPHRQSRGQSEAERMERKAAGGVDFFTTQIIYHASQVTDLLDDMAGGPPALVQAPLLLSLCPVRSRQSFAFLRWLGVEVDEALEENLANGPEPLLERSVAHLVELWERVLQHRRSRNLTQPIGLNIAPVGPIPGHATVELARRLKAVGV